MPTKSETDQAVVALAAVALALLAAAGALLTALIR